MRERIVTRLPLVSLWDEAGPLTLRRGRLLSKVDITGLLASGSIRFAVADCGRPLDWLLPTDVYKTWRSEISRRLVEPNAAEARFHIDDFPNAYCYLAVGWGDAETSTVVVFEKQH